MDVNMAHNLAQPQNRKRRFALMSLALLLIIVGIITLGIGKLFGDKIKQSFLVTSEYQAVFLTNGQVYFGQMSFAHGWIVLKDVYYLQLTEELQPASSTGSDTTGALGQGDQPQSIQLVKLGNELHGPEDAMHIDKDKVLFWENMKSDAKVMESIRQAQNR